MRKLILPIRPCSSAINIKYQTPNKNIEKKHSAQTGIRGRLDLKVGCEHLLRVESRDHCDFETQSALR